MPVLLAINSGLPALVDEETREQRVRQRTAQGALVG